MKKLTIISIWYRGVRTPMLCMGDYNPQTGKTTVSYEAVKKACQLAGVEPTTTYAVGLSVS